MMPSIPTDQQWSAGLVAPFPASWASTLLKKWHAERREDTRAGNLSLLRACQEITRAQAAGIPADANDSQVCQVAKDNARQLETQLAAVQRAAGDAAPRLVMLDQVAEALFWLEAWGFADHWRKYARRSIPAALRRLVCERWWRRALRRVHAQGVESVARSIGLVNKAAGCYVSNDGLYCRIGQLVRNERALENTLAINEQGQEFTLAQLAARGPANRQIRRMELMTRIAGFELLAKDCGHVALFVTVTCPSRMHAWRTRPGRAWECEPNPSHDDTTPAVAQAYLCEQWRKFSEACRRRGAELYGFRIAEPNHDGTPHWHALLFFPAVVARGTLKHNPRAGRPVAYRVVCQQLRRYFLHASAPAERGARKHRVTVERIDWNRGSAAGYVAKYVSKNIDGYKVEKDLYGNDTMTSSRRVDAWASRWHIRQFQQVGGAPVGVWRELRRLHPEQAGAAVGVAMGLDAANITANQPKAAGEAVAQYTAANGWAAYLQLQGGHRVPRQLQRLAVLREQTGEIGQYGEPMAPRAVGIVTTEVQRKRVPAFGIVPAFEQIVVARVEVESERAAWRVVPAGHAPEDETDEQRAKRHKAAADRVRATLAGGAAVRPWSPVNNCTRPAQAPMFAPTVQRHAKRGRWADWMKNKETGGGDTLKAHHGREPNHQDAGRVAGQH